MSKKYFDNLIVNKWIPEEIAEWLEKIVAENFSGAENKWGRWKVKYKAQHTLKVVKWGNILIKNFKEVGWNKKQAIIICFLHDTGRFPQVKQNSYSDIDTGIDHASLGAKMISGLSFDWKNIGCNKAEIIEAIMWHSRKEYPGENPYAKFIRDADKMACFEDWKEMEKDIEDRKIEGTGINPLVWMRLEAKEPIDNNLVATRAEWVLNIASWLWNINYKAARKEAVKMGMDKTLLDEFKRNGNSTEEIKRLERNLEEFKKSV